MLESDPLWYKDAIIYELHVRAFHDSVDDGIGDFRGLTHKLDYLQDLGVTAIWLLPFYPSPLKDDGYDIADYTSIHPDYGRLADFREFLNAAHQRGLRVITELVINHTSDQHWWFQRARRAAPGTPERDFYVWSETPNKYREARIIFKDFEHSNWAWDPVAKAYFWHRFYSHQPDLNFDNPAVWNALFPVVDFWMNMGVDGMRLDAIPYLYEREGTTCENLPETHDFLRALRKHVDERFPNRMLLAEANQWPEDSVAYFGAGDECHMAFHFPVMPRLFMAIHMEDRFPILDILAQTPAIPDNCQWCLFLRNHDELTLEMVTDEERDYMYRAYASETRARINLGIRRRLAPLLGNNRRRIELMNGLLFSLPGTPVLYYGDEIGMGDNIYLGDRNGVRTPMQWSADRNAGFSRANPQKLYLPVIIDPEYHYEAVNVEAQQNNPNSLLWWMKRLIALRKRYRAFGRGTLEFLHPGNRKILAFLRRYQEECILVVANLSRFVQHVELDLSQFAGATPVEMFGANPLPKLGKQPYSLTLGPHEFFWFALEQRVSAAHERAVLQAASLPSLVLRGNFEDLFQRTAQRRLEEVLVGYLQRSTWAGGVGRRIKSVVIQHVFRHNFDSRAAFICLLHVEYDEGAPLTCLLPMALAQEELERLQQHDPAALIAEFHGGTEQGTLFDALYSSEFCRDFLRDLVGGANVGAGDSDVQISVFVPYAALRASMEDSVPVSLNREEQTHTSILFDEQVILKVFRRVEEGIHPEVEVGRFLTEKARFPHVAPVLGVVEHRTPRTQPMTLVILHGYRANEGTAWQHTLDELSRFFERVLALPAADQKTRVPGALRELAGQTPPRAIQELINGHLDFARLLGQRSAEMHLALASDPDDPAFAPEPFNPMYQRSIYQSMRNAHRRTMDMLEQRLPYLEAAPQAEARRVLDNSELLLDRFRAMMRRRLTGQRIRLHGDFNLCEVLFTGKDFIIIDFEGDSTRSLAERRLKRSPLRDVASMIRSLHYAASSALLGDGSHRGRAPGIIRPEDVATLDPWAMTWYYWGASAFVQAYLEHAKNAAFLPANRDEFWFQLDLFQLEKVLHELQLELEYRPHWVNIPLRGIMDLLQARTADTATLEAAGG